MTKADRVLSVPLPHACLRAKERYGLDLSIADLRVIARRCRAGEGRTESNQDGTQFHLIVWGERVLWIVYRPPGRGVTLADGVVLTVMPPHVGSVASRHNERRAARRRGDYRPRRGW